MLGSQTCPLASCGHRGEVRVSPCSNCSPPPPPNPQQQQQEKERNTHNSTDIYHFYNHHGLISSLNLLHSSSSSSHFDQSSNVRWSHRSFPRTCCRHSDSEVDPCRCSVGVSRPRHGRDVNSVQLDDPPIHWHSMVCCRVVSGASLAPSCRPPCLIDSTTTKGAHCLTHRMSVCF